MSELNDLPPKFVSTFIHPLKMIQIVGINIFEKSETPLIKKYSKLILYTFSLSILFILQTLYITSTEEIGAEILDVINAIPTILIVVQNSVKVAILTYKRDQIRKLIMEMGELWPVEFDNEEKENILNYWTTRLQTIDKVCYGVAIVTLLFFEIQPLAFTIYAIIKNKDVKYSFPVLIYFSCSSQCYYKYLLTYTFQFLVGVSVHLCVYISCDLLLVDLTFDLCALLNLLRVDLENLKPLNSMNYNFKEDDCEDLKCIVIKHQTLLRFSETLNKIFEAIIFSQVSISSVIICCYAFMSVIDDRIFFVRHFTAAMDNLFAILIIAWPGQMLFDTSTDIARAAYQCPWYGRGDKFRKSVSIIMCRSQKECHLSALGFSDLTLTLFSKVLSTSWSYLSLLNQMYQDFDA